MSTCSTGRYLADPMTVNSLPSLVPNMASRVSMVAMEKLLLREGTTGKDKKTALS